MGALCTIFARTTETAVSTVRALWTGMLARGANVAGTTNVFAGDVIACFIAENDGWTFLFAAETVEAFGARVCAIWSRPSFVAHANATLCVAR